MYAYGAHTIRHTFTRSYIEHIASIFSIVRRQFDRLFLIAALFHHIIIYGLFFHSLFLFLKNIICLLYRMRALCHEVLWLLAKMVDFIPFQPKINSRHHFWNELLTKFPSQIEKWKSIQNGCIDSNRPEYEYIFRLFTNIIIIAIIIIKWSAIYCLMFVVRFGACRAVPLKTDTNSNGW